MSMAVTLIITGGEGPNYIPVSLDYDFVIASDSGYDKAKDNSLLDTAIRELYEESGIKINKEEIDKNPIHSLGFGKYKWILFHINLTNRPTINGDKEYSNEYIKYKWVKINNYRQELNNREKKHYPLYFFVSYQMKELKRRITFS